MKQMKKKEILVISTGLAPQVITEMLWWLARRDQGPRIVPDAIHVVTTRKGAEIIEEQVLGSEGKLAEFCREFDLPDLNDRLHVSLPEAANPEDADWGSICKIIAKTICALPHGCRMAREIVQGCRTRRDRPKPRRMAHHGRYG